MKDITSSLEKGQKVALVCCSNGLKRNCEENIRLLCKYLEVQGMDVEISPYLYADDSVFSGTGKERAKALMDFYAREDIKAIFDVSGGDLANEILPHLDFSIIAREQKVFWGYSDLTTVINAIYAKTGKSSVLYQIRNLVREQEEEQRRWFEAALKGENEDLFSYRTNFLQGDVLKGTVVGGNIRCLLKLAGTPYFPDMTGKVLLLESRSGQVPQMVTYLNQLMQMGVFRKISGILLGTFTEMEEKVCTPDIGQLVLHYAGRHIPVAKTENIGHGADSKAIWIGEQVEIIR